MSRKDRSKKENDSPPTVGRKEFLLAAGATALLASAPGCHIVRSYFRDFDLIIDDGEVFDGSGSGSREMDIGIREGRITAIGDLKQSTAARRISAKGLAVAPGFIDLHSHSDTNLLIDGRAWSKIFQGVTTEVVGQDGRSVAPLNGAMRRARKLSWSRYDAYFEALRRRGLSVNLTSMVGAGTLREFVIGHRNRYAQAGDIRRMQVLFREALLQGARHLSSGLEYQPGSYASDAELVGIFGGLSPEARRGLVYATHMRNEEDRIESAVAEAITIARWAGVGLHISHFKTQGVQNWKLLPGLLKQIRRARRDGVRITFDRYPYIAYSTGIQSLFPQWSRNGSQGSFLDVLRADGLYERLRRDVERKVLSLGSWDAVQIARLYVSNRALEGRRLGELAREARKDPFEYLLALTIKEKGGGSMVGFGMDPENTERILRDPFCAIASDGSALALSGPLGHGTPHPRSFGSFPRVLGHYVRERGLMSLGEALRKMTALPAQILGLKDRGLIRAGYHADLTIFDPDTIRDRATFTEPRQYPLGLRYVVVNGRVVVDGGDHSDDRPGRVLGLEDFKGSVL